MTATSVVGLQWGDEGKGKIIDVLTEQADVIVRHHGGANAGHTVVVEGEVYKLHLLPVGILHPDKTCVIGNGVAFDPVVFLEEVEELEARGVSISGRVLVSDRAHVVFDFYKLIDEYKDKARGKLAVGTTKRGIGPTYSFKSCYDGIRVCDLYAGESFRKRLEYVCATASSRLSSIGGPAIDVDSTYARYTEIAAKIRPYVADTVAELNDYYGEGRDILFEGAHGALLDVDFGTYPYVTGSNAAGGALAAGSGLAYTKIGRIVGIVKAYQTRVGMGPFPTEQLDATGDRLREKGAEYGTTTNRPRRCGWLDLVTVAYTAKVSGATEIALTKLDVLDEESVIKVATSYEVDGRETTAFPAAVADVEKAVPQYEELPGWRTPLEELTGFAEFPREARDYITFIEKYLGLPVTIVSIGRDRKKIIAR